MKLRLTGLGLVFSAIVSAAIWFWLTAIKLPTSPAIYVTLIVYALLALGFSQVTTIPNVRPIVAIAGAAVGFFAYVTIISWSTFALPFSLVASALITMSFAISDEGMRITG